jgi:hypothetical protein
MGRTNSLLGIVTNEKEVNMGLIKIYCLMAIITTIVILTLNSLKVVILRPGGVWVIIAYLALNICGLLWIFLKENAKINKIKFRKDIL